MRIHTSPLIIVDKESPFQVQYLKQGVVLQGTSDKVEYTSDFEIDSSRHVLKTDKKMTGRLLAKHGNLQKEVTVRSYLPVTVILPNNYLHLPVGESFKLRPLGGTSTYDIEINSEIASVSREYAIHARTVGETIVTVRDRNHLDNSFTFRLKVSEITEVYSL